mmetsp:Transcript_35994/g.60669  ORF Transcript_35994/g.60669 Transcript_35994/m.60669 type:complete len:351 (-) Transcript_35994:135-1187(-)
MAISCTCLDGGEAPQSHGHVCTVFGATGLQGGSVARYLAESGLFAELRLVSRDISKESALAIKAECEAKGAKVTLVCANLDDEVSMDAALAGATHSFLVTNWWELFFANGAVPGVEGFVAGKKAQAIEEAQGYRWVDLCKKHALEFVVYSGLCDAEKLSGFKNIYHFQGKAKIEEYMWANVKGCSVRAGCYMENFLGMIRPQPDGTLALPLGDKPGLPMVSIAEYGGPVCGVFKEGADVWAGKVVNAVSQYCTGQEFVDAWSKAIGKEVKYFACPIEMYAGFGFPGDAELAEMFVFLRWTMCRRKTWRLERSCTPRESLARWRSSLKRTRRRRLISNGDITGVVTRVTGS